ncbi:XdhC/CoxI family protein [Desulfosporosinus fructosivorans]|uniref:XdhC/CoxI family protein n=1 Tax=Desulfosporosinus fructosivorans TaxID=2018669 RepID=A0A4Z0R722_9FIRM|nr:XdhC/CoxI family protein [Desulfosporosinus fructosivorans]TGE38129.1 XdhC/CoxI family protein [Desulfosporosinus fructosivorans]
MDETMIQAICNLQDTEEKAVLATIIRTEGSTPRERGTHMLIMGNGPAIGTIGGGTAENLIFTRALALMTVDNEGQGLGQGRGEVHRIVINQETGMSKLSVCGANMEILLEPIQGKGFWQFVLNLQMSEKDVVMVTSLVPPYTKSIFDTKGNVLWGLPQTGLELSAEKLVNIFSSMQADVLEISEESSWLVEPVLKTTRLLILGAGHVAREIAYYAKPLDFQVTVIDDRAVYALPEFFPGAHAVICSDFETGITNYRPNGDTYVVIVTWSHRTDENCLKDVLNFSAKYVGMLGSTKKVATIVKHLQEEGYTAQNLARLKAPIGLAIGAQTPSEIAISILAEIISVRRAK